MRSGNDRRRFMESRPNRKAHGMVTMACEIPVGMDGLDDPSEHARDSHFALLVFYSHSLCRDGDCSNRQYWDRIAVCVSQRGKRLARPVGQIAPVGDAWACSDFVEYPVVEFDCSFWRFKMEPTHNPCSIGLRWIFGFPGLRESRRVGANRHWSCDGGILDRLDQRFVVQAAFWLATLNRSRSARYHGRLLPRRESIRGTAQDSRLAYRKCPFFALGGRCRGSSEQENLQLMGASRCCRAGMHEPFGHPYLLRSTDDQQLVVGDTAQCTPMGDRSVSGTAQAVR